jgi:disulfide bond formation protein DsbB
MESIKRWKEKILGSCWYTRLGCYCASGILLVGCTTLKKAGITSIAAGGGALAGTVLSGGAAAPILGATTSAFVADVVTEATISEPSKGVVLQTEQGMIECAPDNLWSLLGQVTEIGGWFLILIFVVPMLLGWILPGPLERKKKQKNLFS